MCVCVAEEGVSEISKRAQTRSLPESFCGDQWAGTAAGWRRMSGWSHAPALKQPVDASDAEEGETA